MMSGANAFGVPARERLQLGASELLARGRRGAKALAEDLLPESMLVFRGREGRRKSLSSLRRVLRSPPHVPATPGHVALTFDDGPTSLTPGYLDVLARLDVRATFFVIGELCAARPDLVRAISDGGHELASHGYTHRRFTTLSRAELVNELTRTRALLPQTTGRELVRPPYGAVSLTSLVTCAREGFTSVLWSLNSFDWQLQNASEIEKRLAMQAISPGEILLLHEGQSWTENALPAIVGSLRQAGHELVTVGELLV
jgi:peptidoglycan/xylan/chitin deacetylase (PgdA/CDA1 family)